MFLSSRLTTNVSNIGPGTGIAVRRRGDFNGYHRSTRPEPAGPLPAVELSCWAKGDGSFPWPNTNPQCRPGPLSVAFGDLTSWRPRPLWTANQPAPSIPAAGQTATAPSVPPGRLAVDAGPAHGRVGASTWTACSRGDGEPTQPDRQLPAGPRQRHVRAPSSLRSLARNYASSLAVGDVTGDCGDLVIKQLGGRRAPSLSTRVAAGYGKDPSRLPSTPPPPQSKKANPPPPPPEPRQRGDGDVSWALQ